MKKHQTKKSSVIYQHTNNVGRPLNMENIEVSDHENHYYTRLLSEMIFITKDNNTSNKQTDS